MNAEEQTLAVDVVGQRLEALASGRGREAVGGGEQPPVCVQDEVPVGLAVTVGFRERLGPLDVDDDVFPAEGSQAGCHQVRVGLDLGLGDRSAEGDPGIPAHRRDWRGAGLEPGPDILPGGEDAGDGRFGRPRGCRRKGRDGKGERGTIHAHPTTRPEGSEIRSRFLIGLALRSRSCIRGAKSIFISRGKGAAGLIVVQLIYPPKAD